MDIKRLISSIKSFNQEYEFFDKRILRVAEKIIFQLYDKNFFSKYNYPLEIIAASIYYTIDEITKVNGVGINYFTSPYREPISHESFINNLSKHFNTNILQIKEVFDQIKNTIDFESNPDYFLLTEIRIAIIGMGEQGISCINNLAINNAAKIVDLITTNDGTIKNPNRKTAFIQEIAFNNNLPEDERLEQLKRYDFILFAIDNEKTPSVANQLLEYFQDSPALKGALLFYPTQDNDHAIHYDMLDFSIPLENAALSQELYSLKIISTLLKMCVPSEGSDLPTFSEIKVILKNAKSLITTIGKCSGKNKMIEAIDEIIKAVTKEKLKQFTAALICIADSNILNLYDLDIVHNYFQDLMYDKANIVIGRYVNSENENIEIILMGSTEKAKISMLTLEKRERIFQYLYALLKYNSQFRGQLVSEIINQNVIPYTNTDNCYNWSFERAYFEVIEYEEKGKQSKGVSRFPFYLISPERDVCLCFENLYHFTNKNFPTFRTVYISTEEGQNEIRKALKLTKNAFVKGVYLTRHATDIIDETCIHVGMCDQLTNVLRHFSDSNAPFIEELLKYSELFCLL